MFEHLTHRRIAVCGPQRSGTRITAKIIAHDTGLRYVDEQEFGTLNYARWEELLRTTDGIVVHCPGMTPIIEKCQYLDTLVVMCYRSINDIEASMERINWPDREGCLGRYGLPNYPWLSVPAVVYMKWEREQEAQVDSLRVNYDDLRGHELFVDKRKDWAWDRTE